MSLEQLYDRLEGEEPVAVQEVHTQVTDKWRHSDLSPEENAPWGGELVSEAHKLNIDARCVAHPKYGVYIEFGYMGEVLCRRRTTANLNADAPKYLAPKKKPAIVLGHPSSSTVIVVEGLMDAVALATVFRKAGQAVGVMPAFGNTLTDEQWFSLKDRSVTFALDNDAVGFKQSIALAKEAPEWKVTPSVCDTLLPEGIKDHAQAYVDTPITYGKNVWDELVAPFSTHANDVNFVKASFGEDAVASPRWSTGIVSLDRALSGGLPEGVTVLGAPPSEGKSAFGIMYAVDTAEAGKRVLIVTYENSPMQEWSRIISTYAKPTWTEIENHPERLSNTELERAQHLAKNIHVVSGWDVGQIERAMRKKAYDTVVVDYLQVMPGPYGASDNAKRLNMDHIITTLSRAAVQYHMPVLVISEVGRSSYERVDLNSFKESGAIEYRATVLLGLNNPTHSETQRHISIIKNNRGSRRTIRVNVDLGHQKFTRGSVVESSVPTGDVPEQSGVDLPITSATEAFRKAAEGLKNTDAS